MTWVSKHQVVLEFLCCCLLRRILSIGRSHDLPKPFWSMQDLNLAVLDILALLATSEFSPSYHTTSSTRSQQSSIGRSWFRSSSAGWNFLSLGMARGVQNSPLVSAPTSGFSKLVIFVQNAEAFMEIFKSTHQRNFHLSPARTATRTG